MVRQILWKHMTSYANKQKTQIHISISKTTRPIQKSATTSEKSWKWKLWKNLFQNDEFNIYLNECSSKIQYIETLRSSNILLPFKDKLLMKYDFQFIYFQDLLELFFVLDFKFFWQLFADYLKSEQQQPLHWTKQ